MAESNSQEIGYMVDIDSKYYNTLDIEGFSRMMKDPSASYKFFWLEAIVKLISEGVTNTTFDAVIDEMICNAWYPVKEFHIHLSGMPGDGKIKDGLERAVMKLSQVSELPSNASKIEIKNAINVYSKDIKSAKEQLTNMVPYRALAGFFDNSGEDVNWNGATRLVSYINNFSETKALLPYTLGHSSTLRKEIYFQNPWVEMIQNNTVAILGWIQYEKIKWLQDNNPEVPSIVYKLASIDDSVRKLDKVRKLWEGVIEKCDIRDVFTDEIVISNCYDIDHFIPRSYVMNDELWNLMPMDSALNSSKNNRLPKWNPFFDRFANNQYFLYRLIHQYEGLFDLYKGCYKDNLHSIWASRELYIQGNSRENFFKILEKNMQPIYDSARRQGYDIWKTKILK